MPVSRFLSFLLAALFAGSALAQTPAPAPVPAVPEVAPPPTPAAPVPEGAKAWIVVDHVSGQVLAGENIDEPLPPNQARPSGLT